MPQNSNARTRGEVADHLDPGAVGALPVETRRAEDLHPRPGRSHSPKPASVGKSRAKAPRRLSAEVARQAWRFAAFFNAADLQERESFVRAYRKAGHLDGALMDAVMIASDVAGQMARNGRAGSGLARTLGTDGCRREAPAAEPSSRFERSADSGDRTPHPTASWNRTPQGWDGITSGSGALR